MVSAENKSLMYLNLIFTDLEGKCITMFGQKVVQRIYFDFFCQQVRKLKEN